MVCPADACCARAAGGGGNILAFGPPGVRSPGRRGAGALTAGRPFARPADSAKGRPDER